jgi:hypothetical protein
MRRAILAALLLSSPALAGEKYIGTLVATSSVNNSTTASPFNIPSNQKLSIQCDAAAYILTCTTATGCTATSTNGVKVAADALFTTSTASTSTGAAYVAALSASGTANCRVFTRSGTEG